MDKILEMRDISKSFGSVEVFHDVSIDLYEGEILALVGENGAGKSTMMNVLSGVYPYGEYEGDIFVKGEKCEFRNPNDSIAKGIELIHQEISLHNELTVAENLFMGIWKNNHGIVRWKKMFHEALQYLKMVDLDVDPRTMVYSLSTSQQQLLSIAKALASEPQIILFDEPTSALTEQDADNLMTIIRNLSKKGISCIYISHRLDEVFELADRIVVLRDGELVGIHKNDEMISSNQIVEEMVGRKVEEMYPKTVLPIGNEVFKVSHLTVEHPCIKGKNVVEDVSFEVRAGEILGFSGLIGSGRSETMNAVFGTIKKKSGDIYMNGKKVLIRNPEEAIRQGIGLVTEERKRNGIIATMSLRENMTIVSLQEISDHMVISEKKEKNLASEYYEKLSVKASGIEDNIMNLSGGNQQKIVLSKWLMKNIKVLILDEPTRGVDVGAKVEIYNIVTSMAKRGVAVIMVSSDLPELLGMCDRIIVLNRGTVWGNIGRKDFSQNIIMKAATGIKSFGI